jgi:hypothetical protein
MPEVRPQDERPYRPSQWRDGVRGARMHVPRAAHTLTGAAQSFVIGVSISAARAVVSLPPR